MEYKDYYKILEVDKSAGKDEIKRSYRKLAKKYHPDVNQGDAESQEKFKDINEAYEVLSDDEKRKKYDMFGSQGDFYGGQNFNPSDFGYYTYAGSGEESSGFSDFFKTIFGDLGGFSGFGKDRAGAGNPFSGIGGNRGKRAPRAEYQTEITISLKEAFQGTEKKLHLNINGENKTVDVKIPQGIVPGKKIKVRGERYGLDGDIFIKITIIDSVNKLDGLDITKKLTLLPWEAYFGVKKTVETLHGRLKVTVPAHTYAGQRIRLPNKGFVDMKKNSGDLFLEIVLDNPKHLSEEQEQLYRQMME